MPTTVRPLMYALIRTALVADGVDRCEQRLYRFAREKGFDLAAVFRETGDGGAVEELYCELQRSEARHLLIPTMEHLAGLPCPRRTLLWRLARLRAQAVALPDAGTECAW
ncbi:hypothetical protein [Nocardia sp. NPDC005998]|uniref:hypothetical protein n=1 Tax=Nocardia sp. NPDC005998 TaxID=3156894 RepID=UPI0033BC53D2